MRMDKFPMLSGTWTRQGFCRDLVPTDFYYSIQLLQQRVVMMVSDPLAFGRLSDHVPDWQPRTLLVMVEPRWIDLKNTHKTYYQKNRK